jgi:hypothetical protein
MYESNIGTPTNISFTANNTKSLTNGKSNPAALFLSLEYCWSGAESEKDLSAVGEGARADALKHG